MSEHESPFTGSERLRLDERTPFIFVEKGELNVEEGAIVLLREAGNSVKIPAAGVSCLFLEPGTRVSHRAVEVAAKVGTMLIWVGEAGARMYSAGYPASARSDNLLKQATLALNESTRLAVVRKMLGMRFSDVIPANRSVDQLRGVEGQKVKRLYGKLAGEYGVPWSGRINHTEDFSKVDAANKCISAATSCLYGLSEAAICATGRSPALGFLHTGGMRSFVFDVADLFKFDTVVPLAFRIASEKHFDYMGVVRRACRDMFRGESMLDRVLTGIDFVLDV